MGSCIKGSRKRMLDMTEGLLRNSLSSLVKASSALSDYKLTSGFKPNDFYCQEMNCLEISKAVRVSKWNMYLIVGAKVSFLQ